MAGYNRIVMMGNLTRDPEYKQLASGQSVCRLGLASNRQFKNRQTGDMIQEVCYIDVDVWGPQAESCNQFLQKGRPVLIEGRIKFDTWEDPNGQTRSKHSLVADRVIFLSSASDSSATTNNSDSNVQKNQSLDKELVDQINTVKARTQAGAVRQKQSVNSESKTNTGGEIHFKDEPPFQDDLPF